VSYSLCIWVEFTCFGLYPTTIIRYNERTTDEVVEQEKEEEKKEENSSFSSFVYGCVLPSCYNN